ncbi:hypothetical protein [Archaeoglobus veneficus]|uniref:Uncharacterized protein n=1 Tax=Archaeoglobus veneficus (strain DSM 11195 / SNP6) TaxID=693661 RepID=F2KT23_ARCVS|nr:hypothetical protein [Archaeoglobus veneficus]AEA47053.1 hypothetical protein Arcve_1042 [Archaeoglobus veneficus SNP6]
MLRMHCPNCGCTYYRRVTEDGHFGYYACVKCGHTIHLPAKAVAIMN